MENDVWTFQVMRSIHKRWNSSKSSFPVLHVLVKVKALMTVIRNVTTAWVLSQLQRTQRQPNHKSSTILAWKWIVLKLSTFRTEANAYARLMHAQDCQSVPCSCVDIAVRQVLAQQQLLGSGDINCVAITGWS